MLDVFARPRCPHRPSQPFPAPFRLHLVRSALDSLFVAIQPYFDALALPQPHVILTGAMACTCAPFQSKWGWERGPRVLSDRGEYSTLASTTSHSECNYIKRFSTFAANIQMTIKSVSKWVAGGPLISTLWFCTLSFVNDWGLSLSEHGMAIWRRWGGCASGICCDSHWMQPSNVWCCAPQEKKSAELPKLDRVGISSNPHPSHHSSASSASSSLPPGLQAASLQDSRPPWCNLLIGPRLPCQSPPQAATGRQISRASKINGI